MKLPNANLAIVDREKIADYLLNPAHPDNGGKARFFLSLGFAVAEWLAFADALRKLAVSFEVTEHVESKHGNKYIVTGEIETPSGRGPNVLTVWIVDKGNDKPRLVTAYPGEEDKS
ncbi:MAG TPA: hypothetical protein VJ124_05365 [Pyrinomonadaceae bacterium]|nr:hypothetical protein [Pyrinomonadaceae bacterium]